MTQLPLTPQERQIVEEAFAPFLQTVTIIAKLRGLNPATVQLSADRQAFVISDDSPVTTNGIKSFAE